MQSEALGKRKRHIKDEDEAFSNDELLIQNAHNADDSENERHSLSEDSELDDDSEQSEYAYCEAQEDLPESALFDKDLPSVKFRLETLAKDARKILRSSGCRTKEVRALRKKVKAVSYVPPGATKVIGLVGNAGQGKSSLVNSLTDIPDLAKALDLGESVTWVATIYRRAFAGQKKRFAGRLEYFDLETIGKLLTDAISDWNIYHFEDHENATAQEEDDLRNRANTALSIFRTVFCEMEDFATEKAGFQSLHRCCSSGVSVKQKTKLFVQQAERIMRRLVVGDSMVEQKEFADKSDLHQWLGEHLDEDVDRGGPMLWPFVKQVTIGVKGSRVLDRWVIADLPGLTDSNQVRVNAALRSINNCDFIWAFDQISRINTNGVIDGLAQRYGKAFEGNFAAFATRSGENVHQDMVAFYAKRGVKILGLAEWKACRNAVTKEIKALGSTSSKETSSDALKEIQTQIKTLEQARQIQDDEWWTKVVDGRNTFVSRELQRLCQPHLPSARPLDVFCISNAHYLAQKLGRRKETFTLSAWATQIPVVRKHALSLAAPPAFRDILDFVEHQYTVFIRGLELWASNGGLSQGRIDLIRVIRRPQKAIPGCFDECSEEIKENCSNSIISPLREQQESFAAAAEHVLQTKIKGKAWQTLRAFIRRCGNHKTVAMSESWNELFSIDARRLLDKDNRWWVFVAETEAQIEELCRKVNAVFASIKEQLEREPAAVGLPMGAFDAALNARIAGLRQAFITTKHDMARELRTVILNASNDGPDNYFAKAMTPAYETCQEDRGKGVTARWIQCLHIHINLPGTRSPFHAMTEDIETSLDRIVDTCMARLRSQVDQAFLVITSDCEAMINQETDTASEQALRHAITTFLQTAMPEFKAIKADLAVIKKRYPAEFAEWQD